MNVYSCYFSRISACISTIVWSWHPYGKASCKHLLPALECYSSITWRPHLQHKTSWFYGDLMTFDNVVIGSPLSLVVMLKCFWVTFQNKTSMPFKGLFTPFFQRKSDLLWRIGLNPSKNHPIKNSHPWPRCFRNWRSFGCNVSFGPFGCFICVFGGWNHLELYNL